MFAFRIPQNTFYLDNPYKNIFFALKNFPKNFLSAILLFKYKFLRKFQISVFYSKNSKYPRFSEQIFTKLLIITLKCPDKGPVHISTI